MPPEKHSQR